MFKLSAKQSLTSRWGRLVLGVFVFGWINAVAQPCVMGMTAGAEMSVSAMHGEHGGHVMEHDNDGGDCGRCPPGGHDAPGSCQSIASPSCGASADVAVDGRTIKLEPGSLPDDAEALLSSEGPPPGQVAQVDYRLDCQSRILPAGPPINLRNCVFLK